MNEWRCVSLGIKYYYNNSANICPFHIIIYVRLLAAAATIGYIHFFHSSSVRCFLSARTLPLQTQFNVLYRGKQLALI